jgi:hypothetical protein
MISHYDKKDNHYHNSVADILLAEKAEERLMKYIEKHLSIEVLEKYYTGFVASFPEKTLALFRQTIDKYAERNMGRDSYEYIAGLLKKMIKIEGGKVLVTDMINQYKIRYRNRRAMMEILNRLNK